MDEETKKRIAEIKGREQKATAGPWEIFDNTIYGGIEASMFVADSRDNDAPFIAHARQDIPFLLDALEKARTEIENLKIEINQMREDEGFSPPYAL